MRKLRDGHEANVKHARPIRQAIEGAQGGAPAFLERERDAFASLELHIEELVLQGFSPGDRLRIGDALEIELARLITERGLPRWSEAPPMIEQLKGGSFKVTPSAPPQVVGEQLARALYGSFDALPGSLPKGVRETLQSPGEPLDADTRSAMEARFHQDFSQVRAHTDSRAAGSAQALNAQAYTVGDDMVFGQGRYAPRTPQGRRLLAHELTHVVQQRSGGAEGRGPAQPGTSHEHEARAIANVIASSERPVTPRVSTGTVLARQELNPTEEPPIEHTFEVQPLIPRMDAYAVPECDAPKIYDPDLKKCVPPPCQHFDLDQARQFAITKLTQTAAFVPKWAAGIRRGRFASFFPPNLQAELTGGVQAVVAELKAGTLKIECTAKVSSGNVGIFDSSENKISLSSFISDPMWSQNLLNRVVIHECLHAVLSHLPSQKGKDPYDIASRMGLSPSDEMHKDLLSIMSAYPNDTLRW